MTKETIRVEPLSTYLERVKAPVSVVTLHGDTIYVSGLPPFDPQSGEVVIAPIERQTELVLEQLKLCVETAGSSLEKVLKCNVYAPRPTNSPPSTRSMRGISRKTRRRAFLSACLNGSGALISRSTASRRCRHLVSRPQSLLNINWSKTKTSPF